MVAREAHNLQVLVRIQIPQPSKTKLRPCAGFWFYVLRKGPKTAIVRITCRKAIVGVAQLVRA